MFIHVFIYRFKCVIRDRQVIFWTFLFPLLLATLFGLAFSNMMKTESFKGIPIAVVDNQEFRQNIGFKNALLTVSGSDGSASGKAGLFHTVYASKEQVDESLKSNQISGYILFENGVHVVVRESGIHQTILKEFVNHFLQQSSAVGKIIKQNPEKLQEVVRDASINRSFIKEVSPAKVPPNMILTYFYALIAMTCLYGGFLGIDVVTSLQADLSSQGARVNMAPVHKLKVFASSMLAATVVQMMSVLILIAYLIFVIKVDFGNRFAYVLLACLAGCIAGVSMGTVMGALVKAVEGVKIAVFIGISLMLSFLAGLQWAQMKYYVTSAVPAMAYLNPANLIADAFYALYYYDTLTRYYINIGLLFGFAILFYLIVYFVMRRQKYASL